MTLHTYIDELDHQMDMLESRMLQKKPWYLQGETIAKDREENALLGEHLEVQRHAIYIPSAIDESTIVDFIKRGIKERAFDSAVLKVKHKETATSNKVIGGSSKTSLVEDYENLYIKAKALEKVQEDPEKDALRREIIELFDNLDALSSMHFVPRSRVDGYNIITNKQALVLEEAGPTAAAEGDLLAPEEVFEPRGEPIKGTSEITSTDRRRHRKKLMRIRAKQREARAKMSARTDDRRAAMNKIIKMAHKPGSKIKIAK
ncbi:u3 small nucleolar ribonucleoprotein MPP10 [Sparganum proliferum]